jgi:cephalosporin-C deacetylase
MPNIDMPIKELEKYYGITPMPEDFNEYWDSAVAEMREIDPQISMTEANFQCPGVKCYDLYYTGVHGARIYAKFMRPEKVEGKIPAVLLFHGYSGDSGYWMDKLGYVLAGAAVFAMDCRGQAGKSEDIGNVKGNTLHGHFIRGLADQDPNKLLFRDIFLDTAQLAKIAIEMDIIDENKIYAYGGSQGGALTIACAALEPRVRKAAALYPFLSDYKRVWEMDLDIQAYAELKDYFRNFDPRHEREEEIFTKLGYIDVQNLAARVKADVLMFTGLMDTICPPSTQYAVYNKMTCRKRHILYPDYTHEDLKGAADMVFDYLFYE